MPSNVDLTEKAQTLAKELGLVAETDGKNNQQLVEEVKRLQAIQAKGDQKSDDKNDPDPQEGNTPPEDKSDASEDDDQQATTTTPKPEPKPKAEKVKGPVVADGKSVTSLKRGILAAGDPISAKDLGGGEEAFKALKKKGFIKA